MSYPGGSEFGFELLTCRWAEREWPPDDSRDGAVVVARQLGTRDRRWDTVVVEADPAALAARAAFGRQALDSDLLHVVRHAPERWRWYRDALPDPGYPWRYVREAVHRAADRDVLETRREGNRIQIRRVAPYPDWVRRIVAIENKPDLDAAAARALSDQLEYDVSSGLADEVWVATAATGATIEPALLEDVPVDVGILAMEFDDSETSASVLWHPGDLTVDSRSTATRERRLVLAERAYGRGWRSYVDTMRPDCRHFELQRAGRALIPWCGAFETHQRAARCAGSCEAFEPEPPGWRTQGWPIEGGPGKALGRLLDRRRKWARRRDMPE